MKRLTDETRKCLQEAGLLHKAARLLCAVSGGADSVALLCALKRLQLETGFRLEALHVQHGLRGEHSAADEHFVRTLCAEQGIPLCVCCAQLSGTMEDAGIESRARDERIRLMREVMSVGSFDAVLLGHHRDDQAETVLMHLLRGSGMQGLGGMRRCVPFGGGVMLRPFLMIPKAELKAALSEAGCGWCEDESNARATNPRNAMRLNLLPEMETLYPGAGRHIAQAAQVLREESDYLEAQADALFQTAAYCVAPFRLVAKQPLLDAHPALVRRALRRLCPVALNRADTLALEALLRQPDGTMVNLPQGMRALIWTHHLHILPPVDPPSKVQHLSIQPLPVGELVPRTPDEVVLSPKVQALGPVVRLPKTDDAIRPFGAPGAKPLRRFYTDRKVDPCFRWRLPVLACGNDVLWIPGLCASETLRLGAVPPGSIRLGFASSIPFYPHQSKE